jgi:hypothetical protein
MESKLQVCVGWDIYGDARGSFLGVGQARRRVVRPEQAVLKGRDWLVSMGRKGLGKRFMAILTREGLYAAVSKGE